MNGIIRAITPGMVLGSYLKSHKELSLLKKILRSHLDVKDTIEPFSSAEVPWNFSRGTGWRAARAINILEDW